MTCRRRWVFAKINMNSNNKRVGRLHVLNGPAFVVCTLFTVVHEYKNKLTANEEEQQELLRVLEQTKRMGYARDLQISMLESDSQLMLEKCEFRASG